jgi:hypothetical protein
VPTYISLDALYGTGTHKLGCREIGAIKSEELKLFGDFAFHPSIREFGTYIVIANNFEKLWHIDAI